MYLIRGNPDNYFKICNKCKNSYLKTPEYFFKKSDSCLKCDGQVKIFRHEKYNEKRKEYLKKRMRDNVKNLSDEYVSNLIIGKQKVSKKEQEKLKSNKELLSLKKNLVKLKRELNKWKSTKNT